MQSPALFNNRHADWEQGNAREFDVLQAERDADDCDETQQRGDEVTQGQAPADADEPEDVANDAERAGADIAATGNHLAADDFFAEGEE